MVSVRRGGIESETVTGWPVSGAERRNDGLIYPGMG